MKKYIFRVLSALMAVIFLAVLCAPSFAATDPAPTDSRGDFYDWVINSGSLDKDRPGGPFGPGGGGGRFSKEHYDEWVSTLPAPGYTSDGGLLIPFTVISHYNYNGGGNPSCNNHTVSTLSSSSCTVQFMCDSNTIIFSLASGKSSFTFRDIGYGLESELLCPYDGYYVIWEPKIQYSYMTSSGEEISSVGSSGDEKIPFGMGTYYTVGSKLSCSRVFHKNDSTALLFATFTCATPLAKFTPAPSVDPGYQTQYNINTRPTTITGGNYGIVGDDNNITTVTNTTQIVNEGDNLYYNPATGQTQTITDWTYNYDNRIYDITLDTGDKVSVEYGDENITITENNVVEGDTIVNNYTIYYMIDGSGSGESHTHEWYKTGERQATCLVPAQRTYTCSICGEQKTETDPVLGHSWHAIQTVTTQYDDDGNQTQEGYTIYECERCGEQYKSTNNTGPPPSGGDSSGEGDDKESVWDKIGNFFGIILEGIIGIFDAILGKLLDALVVLSEMLLGKVKDVVAVVLSVLEEVPALFGGFLDFLGLVFPFLPSEITLLLTFGVIAVVFIGIIKALRR